MTREATGLSYPELFEVDENGEETYLNKKAEEGVEPGFLGFWLQRSLELCLSSSLRFLGCCNCSFTSGNAAHDKSQLEPPPP